jgi:hypothetical protein
MILHRFNNKFSLSCIISKEKYTILFKSVSAATAAFVISVETQQKFASYNKVANTQSHFHRVAVHFTTGYKFNNIYQLQNKKW